MRRWGGRLTQVHLLLVALGLPRPQPERACAERREKEMGHAPVGVVRAQLERVGEGGGGRTEGEGGRRGRLGGGEAGHGGGRGLGEVGKGWEGVARLRIEAISRVNLERVRLGRVRWWV